MNISLHVLYNCCKYVFVCRDVSDGDISVQNKFFVISNL